MLMHVLNQFHRGTQWNTERCNWIILSAERKSHDALTILDAVNKRENKPFTLGGAKKCGGTQQVRQKPQTHEPASQNYIRTAVQQVLKLFKCMHGSSQWIPMRRVGVAMSTTGGRFKRQSTLVGLGAAVSFSQVFNLGLHTKLSTSWLPQQERNNLCRQNPTLQERIRTNETSDKKSVRWGCFYWVQLLLQPQCPAQLSSLLDTSRKCLGCLMKSWTVISWWRRILYTNDTQIQRILTVTKTNCFFTQNWHHKMQLNVNY